MMRSNVRWIIQSNLSSENTDYKRMVEICDKFGYLHEGVQVIPFSEEPPSFTLDGINNIYYGSTNFINNVFNGLNKPSGVFFDEDSFSIENYINIWGDYMLNSGGKVTTFKKFAKEKHNDTELFFIRPDADDKSFAGDVRTFGEICTFLKSNMSVDNIDLTEDTKILVSTPYQIKKEWRNYIVNGKVVTSSLYRKNFRLNIDGSDAPDDMIDFVEARCLEYTPSSAFVMDIALCGDKYYIIECGCINSVGLYGCDLENLMVNITNHVIKKY